MCIGVSSPLKNTNLLFFNKPPLKSENRQAPLLKQFSLIKPIPSHLLKVTKFLVEISQFKFLVMRQRKTSWGPAKFPTFWNFGWRLNPHPPPLPRPVERGVNTMFHHNPMALIDIFTQLTVSYTINVTAFIWGTSACLTNLLDMIWY